MSRDIERDFDEYETPIADAERIAFERVTNEYYLISKIGEGTFSTVYKAEDCFQDLHDNSWLDSRGGNRNERYYVAIKRIYVTSSPQRIFNELDILQSLQLSDNVLPIITAFRHEDQVFIVLPYFKHPDFRSYYKKLPLRDIRYYMRSLFLALEDVHAENVIHRDVKPTNFLYDVNGRKGELVDFGLAERQQVPGHCPCQKRSGKALEKMTGMVNPTHVRLKGVYLKDDQRPGKRANRAGTRGFRAPEVLFKCDSQFTAVDIWSAGVILLTFLSTRFPFFNSNDDVEALIELTSIFGKTEMKTIAAQHDCSFETTVPTLHERPISFTRLVHWSTDSQRKSDDDADTHEQAMAIDFLARCMTPDPWQRWTATEALDDEFLAGLDADVTVNEETASTNDIAYDAGGLESAAEIDSPMVHRVSPVHGIPTQLEAAQPIYQDSTSEARIALQGRPREFVFLKTDDYPDDNLHHHMRQQLISNVNTMRAKREASMNHLTAPAGPETSRPILDGRSRSASASMGNGAIRAVTPLNQILSNSPNQNIHHMNHLSPKSTRAKSMSPGKGTQVSMMTIDPRLTQLPGSRLPNDDSRV